MKKIMILISLLLSLNTFAQNNLEEVVYLKNGSIIRGVIIEQIPNESLKIQTKDGSVFVYKFDEVERITKENAPKKQSNNSEKTNSLDNAQTIKEPKDYYKKGFMGITEIGPVLLFASGGSGFATGLSFNQVLGSRTSEKFGAGMGFGLEYFRGGGLTLPVTIDMRVFFMKGRVTPILYIAPGYQFFTSTSNFTSGVHAVVMNFGPGVDFKINKKVGISAVTGYKFLDILPQKGGSNFILHGWFFRVGVNY